MTCFGSNSTANGSFAWDVARATYDCVMLTLIILTNAAILAIVARRWSREGMPIGNVTSSLLVINLSAADFLMGVFRVLHYLPKYVCGLEAVLAHSYVLCLLRFVLIITAHSGSGYTLVAIAADRYVAVCHALHYKHLVTPTRSLAIIGFIWAFSAGSTTLLFAWNNYDGKECSETRTLPKGFTMFFGLFGQLLILGSVTWAHYCVHREVVKLRRRAKEGLWTRSGSVGGVGGGGAEGGVSGGVGTALSKEQRVGTRASRVLAMILIVYVASWGPLNVVFVLRTCGVQVPLMVIEAASSFLHFNYLVNPFIYAYHNRPIQRTIGQCFSSLKRRTFFESRSKTSVNSMSLSKTSSTEVRINT